MKISTTVAAAPLRQMSSGVSESVSNAMDSGYALLGILLVAILAGYVVKSFQ